MLKRILKNVYLCFKIKNIKKNCIVSDGTIFGLTANCISDYKYNIVIGRNCDLHCSLISQDGGHISVGDNTTIRYESKIGAVNSIMIGNNVIISNNVTIYDNNNHPTSPAERYDITQNMRNAEKWRWKNSDSKPVVIEDNVWIGERCAILKGVHIGKGSIVGLGSVVTKDVPPYTIVAGNPAKVVKILER